MGVNSRKALVTLIFLLSLSSLGCATANRGNMRSGITTPETLSSNPGEVLGYATAPPTFPAEASPAPIRDRGAESVGAISAPAEPYAGAELSPAPKSLPTTITREDFERGVATSQKVPAPAPIPPHQEGAADLERKIAELVDIYPPGKIAFNTPKDMTVLETRTIR